MIEDFGFSAFDVNFEDIDGGEVGGIKDFGNSEGAWTGSVAGVVGFGDLDAPMAKEVVVVFVMGDGDRCGLRNGTRQRR